MAPPAPITELLLAWRRGEQAAHDQLLPAVYAELRHLAHRYVRGERRGATLSTSALVNEAYLRLVDSRRVQWRDRSHFFAVAAQLMRRILVDAARRRRSHKRQAEGHRVPLETALNLCEQRSGDLVALDDALTALAGVDERKARVVELRFFGGLTAAETAEVLAVSEDTVLRDWRLAKGWLLREMTRGAKYAG
jgi:RNA polymerase sigma factor (TIGR02999 family)